MTMTLITTVAVGPAGTTLITFDNIPQTYTDLMISWSARSSHTGSTQGGLEDWTNCNFNNNATGPTLKQLYGTGTSVSTGGGPYFELGRMVANNATANTFGSVMTYIPNYTGSMYKAWTYNSVSENNGTAAWQFIATGIWANTAAITSIAISPAIGSFMQYTTASLYGIKKGSGGATVS